MSQQPQGGCMALNITTQSLAECGQEPGLLTGIPESPSTVPEAKAIFTPIRIRVNMRLWPQPALEAPICKPKRCYGNHGISALSCPPRGAPSGFNDLGLNGCGGSAAPSPSNRYFAASAAS